MTQHEAFLRAILESPDDRGSGAGFQARVQARPLGPDVLSTGLLRSLGLACLAGTAEENLRAARVTPREAFATLYSAASTGGAYNRGVGGAYKRLAAWQSLAGLAGASGDDVEAVVGLAARCLWVSWDAASEWYHQVARDLGLLAVRPDGMSLAVLAATDTD